MGLVELVATNDIYENNPKSFSRTVSPDKLFNIYNELRKNVFLGSPIQENSGDNEIVFRNQFGPAGNYGWQLFRVEEGTAILEYKGPVSYWPHERRPLPLGEEKHLDMIWLTFHQEGNSVEKARKIIEKNTKKREEVLVNTPRAP